MKHIQAKFDIT